MIYSMVNARVVKYWLINLINLLSIINPSLRNWRGVYFKNYLDDYNFGFQFGERDGESLISHLRYLKNSPDDLLLLQKNARELFDKKFCHTRVFEAAEEHIIRCCSEANRSKRRQKLDWWFRVSQEIAQSAWQTHFPGISFPYVFTQIPWLY